MRHWESAFFAVAAFVSAPANGQSTTCISAPPWLEIHADGEARWASLSRDGRYIAFFSESPALVSNDTNQDADIFVFDRLTGQYELVSRSSSGGQFDFVAGTAISDDGRYVGFCGLDFEGAAGVFVRDRNAGVTVLVNRRSDGTFVNDYSGFWGRIAISATGRFVAFDSASDLMNEGTPQLRHIYVHDRDFDANGVFDEAHGVRTERVSVSTTGIAADAGSRHPAMSPDGRFITFRSDASNLVTGDTNGLPDVFIHDRDADGNGVFDEPGGILTDRVSVTSANAQLGGASAWWSSVSADGRFVVFHSEAPELFPGGTPGVVEVYLRDRLLNETIRVSASGDGGASPGNAALPSISDDGRFVCYAANYGGSGNWGFVVFDRLNRSRKPLNFNHVNTLTNISWAANGVSSGLSMSPDGRLVVLVCGGLLTSISRPSPSIYLRDRGPHYLADIDGAGTVNVSDLLAVISAWGACQPAPIPCAADLNGDGTVNVTDLLMIISNRG